jgi:RHS repeat-associated protein
VTYAYDANGNETSNSQGRATSYNNRNHASSITPPGLSARTQTYGGPTQFEWLSNGSVNYMNDLLGVASEKDGAGATRYFTRTPTGTVIGQREAGGANRYYVHPDALGSTVNVTNGSGVEQADWEYDPYGQRLAESSGNPPVNWAFAGQYRSEPLSLYKMGHRFYDPKLGRWTQVDPIDQASDLRESNRYGYAGADPINLTDPTGTDVARQFCTTSMIASAACLPSSRLAEGYCLYRGARYVAG